MAARKPTRKSTSKSQRHARPESFGGFPPGALKFLRSLARNNRREWFEANRSRYESDVKFPLQVLVEEIDARLGEIAPEMIGNPKKSVFRIYRDVHFSKDKSPYKTNAAAWFFHRDAGHA
ncbi:MAG: TIGR02453 family protein, partial [Gemmatimonadota bacterium]|nr:TIGR02453 family protein [Gemmatimonadota bacterium]